MRLLPHSTGIAFAAPGAETVIRAATDRPWKLLALRFVLTTSATVAVRIPRLKLRDGSGAVVWEDRSAQAESLEYANVFVQGVTRTSLGTVAESTYIFPLPEELWIQPSWSFVLSVDAMEADDVLSAGNMVYALLWDEDGEPYAEEFEE